MARGFWGQLEKPIIGLAPMDGITDEPFRFITKKYGNPDVIFTEFSNVTGVVRGSIKLLEPYMYHESERPIVAQMFGKNPQDFYLVTILLCFLGFDGIDINMGCPSKSVATHGAGAGLIKTPKLAQEIIKSCKRAVKDWVNGVDLTSLSLPQNILNEILLMQKMQKGHPLPKRVPIPIPVSIKTRLGYDKPIVDAWIPQLLEAEPAIISLHGRTLKEMYKGQANWDEIGKAARIVHKTDTIILGNGDVQNRLDAEKRAKKYHVDGVLIGRAALGNPWVFSKKPHTFTKDERLKIALEHTEYFVKLRGEKRLFEMRKHWGYILKGFDGAKKLRQKLMVTSLFREVTDILQS